MTKESTVVLAVPSCPMVKLDDKYYKLVDKMEALTESPPSMIHAKSLTVKGPVKFVKGVVIKGNVTFENGIPSFTSTQLVHALKFCKPFLAAMPAHAFFVYFLFRLALFTNPYVIACSQYAPVHATADTKEPISLESKTYENTTEKLGHGKQQQQQATPAGVQTAYA